jgi:magnesium chelatase family protein
VTRIHSVAGTHRSDGLIDQRPFRAPHHTISAPGLVGGGSGPSPGEASLAHHGVLFLDELSEFARPALEALRQPLEDGRVAIVRGQHTAVFPTRFMLVAATNPCPCGFAGDERRCECSQADLARHHRRLSGPLLDRIDVRVDVQRPTGEALGRAGATDSERALAAVTEARERQYRRLAGTRALCNADMDAALVRTLVVLDERGAAVLRDAYERSSLSARGHERVVKVARTIADLAGSERVSAEHILQALDLRGQEQQVEVVA